MSTWRLQLTGRRSVDDPGMLGDVTLTVRYTAEVGDPVFANAVKGMLKPYRTYRYLDVAGEFPDEWAEFLGGDGDELVLPVSADLFPNMAGRQITSVYTRFELAAPGAVTHDAQRSTGLDARRREGAVGEPARRAAGAAGAWRARATRAC